VERVAGTESNPRFARAVSIEAGRLQPASTPPPAPPARSAGFFVGFPAKPGEIFVRRALAELEGTSKFCADEVIARAWALYEQAEGRKKVREPVHIGGVIRSMIHPTDSKTEREFLAALSTALRAYPGLDFEVHFPLGPYRLDFAFPDVRLCIEIDGPQHEERREHDAKRDRYLFDRGWKTLRISAAVAWKDPHGYARKVVQVYCEMREGRDGPRA